MTVTEIHQPVKAGGCPKEWRSALGFFLLGSFFLGTAAQLVLSFIVQSTLSGCDLALYKVKVD